MLTDREILHQAEAFIAYFKKQDVQSVIWSNQLFEYWADTKGFSEEEKTKIWEKVKTIVRGRPRTQEVPA